LKLQQEASKVKKELENTFIESEINWLVVTINWEMKVEKTEFETINLIPWLNTEQKAALEKAITEAVNKWVKKSQEVAAEKMQWVMSQMWMGDMFKGGMPWLN
jgi:DNA-binding protein YbaB